MHSLAQLIGCSVTQRAAKIESILAAISARFRIDFCFRVKTSVTFGICFGLLHIHRELQKSPFIHLLLESSHRCSNQLRVLERMKLASHTTQNADKVKSLAEQG